MTGAAPTAREEETAGLPAGQLAVLWPPEEQVPGACCTGARHGRSRRLGRRPSSHANRSPACWPGTWQGRRTAALSRNGAS